MFEEGQANRLPGMARERALQAKNCAGMQRMGKWKSNTQCAGVRREIKKTVNICGNGRELEKKQRDIKFNQEK